jgi:hypothetical protein
MGCTILAVPDRQSTRIFTIEPILSAKLSGFFVGSIVIVFTASIPIEQIFLDLRRRRRMGVL